MLKWIIALVIIWFLEDTLVYKYIRHIDIKERKKINEMEKKHFDFMLEDQEKDDRY